jgi:hypothetical protein
MATHLPENATIQTAADACAGVAGGLDSDPATQNLTPLWDALTNKGDTLMGARRLAERTLGRARAKLAVMDALWDPEIAAFGRDVVDETGGKRDQAPYTRFFKTVNPSTAQTFGTDREVELGKSYIAELNRIPNETLATKWIPRLTTATENLSAASTNRRNALQTLALQNTAEELFIADVNREIDILEGELLKRFPGQPKRVASYLDATRPTRKRSRASQDPGDDKAGE